MASGPIGIQSDICVDLGRDATMKGSGPSFSRQMSPQPERSRMDALASSQLVGSVMWGSTGEGANIMGRALGGSALAGKEIYSDIVRQVSLYA